MAESRTRLAQLKSEVAPCEAPSNNSTTARLNLRQNQRQAATTVMPLPLAVSLKRALIFSGAEEHIPRTHARRLLALLQLQEV